jgi:hypothetical protein
MPSAPRVADRAGTCSTSVASSSAGSVTTSPVAVMIGAPASSRLNPTAADRRAMTITTTNSTSDDSRPPMSEIATRSSSGTVFSPSARLIAQAMIPAWVADAKLRIVDASICRPR